MLTIFRLCLTTPEFKDVSALEADRLYKYCIEHYKLDQNDYFEVSDLAKMIFQLVLSQLALNIILNQFAEQSHHRNDAGLPCRDDATFCLFDDVEFAPNQGMNRVPDYDRP